MLSSSEAEFHLKKVSLERAPLQLQNLCVLFAGHEDEGHLGEVPDIQAASSEGTVEPLPLRRRCKCAGCDDHVYKFMCMRCFSRLTEI